MLSFTSDEIWQHLPGKREEIIFTQTWYEGLFALDETDAISNADWDRMLEVRAAVSKELEKLRVEGTIGAALDARVDVYADDSLQQSLLGLQDEIRFVLITSEASVQPLNNKPQGLDTLEIDGQQLAIAATAADGNKCVRCWHHRSDVGKSKDHPELCGRCIANVDGSGEIRRYA